MKDISNITKQLEEGVRSIFGSEEYKKYLEFAGKFHDYSFNNIVLILSQMPNATRVAGYKAWQKLGRQVRKGEKSISILAPVPHKNEVEEVDMDGKVSKKEVTWMSYRAVSVFDISQTDGEEVPSSRSFCKVLEGNVEGYDEVFGKLVGIAQIPVEFEQVQDGSNGYYDTVNKRIALNEGMSQAQTIKTLIHEIAHSVLHSIDGDESNADRNTKELQAESVAYTVCSYLGLDSSEYSFGYIAGWSKDKDVKVLTSNMEVIRKTAETIISAI